MRLVFWGCLLAVCAVAGPADEALAAGVAALDRGAPSAAAEALRRAVDADPELADARLALGNALLALDDHRGAAREYGAAAELRPDLSDAHYNLGVARFRAGQPKRAARHFADAVALSPEHASAHYNLGVARNALGRYARAAEAFRAAAALGAPNARLSLADALREDNQLDAAAQEYLAVLRADPASEEANVNLGSVYFQQEDWPRAAERFRAAGEHFNLGIVQARMGLAGDAERSFRAAAQRHPGQWNAWYELGKALAAQNRHREAIEALQTTLALRPQHKTAWTDLGVALADVYEFPAAIAAYEQASRVDPAAAAPHINRGLAHFNLADVDAAVECYRDAVRADPAHVDAHMNLANALHHQKRLAEAADAYRAALAVAPAHGETRIRLGKALRELGRAEEGDAEVAAGVELIEREIAEATPASHTPAQLSKRHFYVAHALDRRGDYAAAWRHYAEGNRLRRVPGAEAATQRLLDQFRREMAAFPRLDADAGGPWSRSRSRRPIFVLGLPRSGTSLVEAILSADEAVFGAGEVNDVQDAVLNLTALAPPGQHYSAALSRRTLSEHARAFLASMRRRAAAGGASGAQRVVVKPIYNFMYVGLIRRMFPDAPIVHCARGGRDNVLSIHLSDFSQLMGFEPDLALTARVYEGYREMMDHWDAAGAGVFHLQYEQLIADPPAVVRALVDHVGLEFGPHFLEFHKSDRVVYTASWAQVREPFYSRSVGRWLHYAEYLGELEGLGEYEGVGVGLRDRS